MHLFVILTFTFRGLPAQIAENSNHEIHFGYGFLSDIEIIAVFAERYSRTIGAFAGHITSTELSTTGPVIIGFNFRNSKKLTIGPEINLMQLKIRDRYSSGITVHGSYFVTNVSSRIDFRYVKRENLQMYSGIMLGISYIFDQSSDELDDNSTLFPSYQLNFFGIRFGKSWGGYAEIGFGRNGLLNIGVSKKME